MEPEQFSEFRRDGTKDRTTVTGFFARSRRRSRIFWAIALAVALLLTWSDYRSTGIIISDVIMIFSFVAVCLKTRE